MGRSLQPTSPPKSPANTLVFESLEPRLLLAADPLGVTAGYAFNEASGTTAVDASGHGLTGTLTSGAAFTTAGKYGNAVVLDGVNDYVNLGNPTALQLTGSTTISAWIYSTAFPWDDAAIVSKRTGEVGFQLDTTVDTGPRTIGFKLTNSSGGQMFRYGATALQLNTWYYVTGVYDAAAQTLDVYLNGQLDNGVLQGTVTSSQQNSTANVNIGRRSGATGFEFVGRIDDVRIADHALTADQIQTDMITPLGGAPAPDTVAPVVTLTAPPAGFVAGTISVTATATDNIGVAGVQFLLDNNPLGAEDTTSPYSVSWNTTTATNGVHTLSARGHDFAGNLTTVSMSVTVDNQTPAGTIVINGGAAATNSTTVTLSLSASDALSGISQMRFSNNGTTFSTAEAYAASKSWTLTTGAGTKTVYVQFRDGAGNWSASFTDTIVLDTTAPTISARTATNITSNSATVTWTTNEPATSQVDYGLTTSYGSTTTLDPNLVTAHTVLLTGLAPGTTYNYRVRSVDAAGNQTVSANSTFTTVAVDTVAPTVQSINRVGATPTNAASVSWTVLFSEGVTGVDASDFALATTGGVTSATITSVTGSGNQYTVTANSGAGSGTLGLNLVDNDTIRDTSANANLLGGAGTGNGNFTGQTYTLDKSAPSVTINQAASQADPVSAGPINFTVTFSETVTGFAASDVSFTGSTVGGTLTAVVTGTGTTYNVAVSGMTGTGTVVVSVPAAAATDAAGNASLASTSTDNAVTFSSADTIAPTVTINQAAGQTDPTGTSPINFTVTFSETVTGFSASDVSFAGSTVSGALTVVVTGTGPTYNVAVSGMTGTGTVVVSVPAGAATDAAGNASLASTSTDNAVTYSNTSGFQNQILAIGFDLPTAIKFLPDGRLLVVELAGTIKVLPPPYTQADATPFLQLTNVGSAGVQQGIYDIALDPNFATNHFYYIFYTAGTPNHDRLSRFTANPTLTGTVAGSETILYEDSQNADAEHHGGSINFGNDGKIYFTTGDHFQGTPSQSLNSPRGKILRINPDGSVPTDNPFYDGAGPNYDAIWALGLRNPFRAYYDAPTGRLLIGDVGGNVASTAIEELNVGVAGANYGWPNVEGTTSNPAFTNPIYSYAHNGRDASITGGFVYHGTQFPSSYQGSYFFADYAQNWIKRLTFDANGNVNGVFNFEPANGAADGPYGDIVYLTEGPDGALYYVDLGYSDTTFEFGISKIRRISYVSSDQPPVVAVSATPTGGPAPLTVTFSSTGSSDPEGQQLTYSWNFGDGSALSTVANPVHTYNVAGPYQVRLTVSDGVNSTISTPLSISVGNLPVIANLQAVVPVSPANNGLFRAGDVISFSATATDSEDGTLPASAYTWQIDFLHEGHVHPGIPIVGVTSGSFAIPTSGHDFSGNTRYRVTLTVKDSDGLQSSQSVLVFPDKVNLTFDTTPGGLTVFLDGIAHTAPFVYDTLIGFSHTIEARNAVVGANTYNFVSWSDGGAQLHNIVVSATAQTYAATYNVVSTPAPPAFVQVNAATPQTNQSSVSVAYTSAQVAGNTNILAIGWNDATSNITSVTDSAGNIYQLAVPVARGAGLSQAIYYARNITAAAAGTNTVTVTFNAATPYVDIRALEYSGLDPLNPFDVGTSASGNSASANSGSVTTTAASELIFAAGMTTGGFSAAGASFTNRIITTPDLDIAEDRFVTTTGSYNATASLNGASAWVMQVATFRAATGGTDTIAPTVTINQAAGQADPTSASPINFTVTFSETVTGFTASDISFAGSTVGGTLTAVVSGSGPTYNVAVSGMTGAGAVVVSIPAGAATDAAGNASVASTSTDNSVAFSNVDTIAPTVQSINRVGATPTNAASVSWTVLFSENVTGVDAADFAVVTTGFIGGATITSVTGNGNQYTVTASTGTDNGTLGLNLVDNDTIVDASANPLAGPGVDGSFTGQIYTLDKLAPTVTINQAAGQADPTNASPINFTVTFSETVTGFAASDISFAGSTVGGTLTAVVTGSGTTYNVAVSGMSSSGTVVVSVPAGAATDAAGNTSLAATSTDNAVTYNAPASPAIAFVQVNAATPQTNQSSVSVAYTSAQVAGNTNILAIGWNDATSNITSVTDSAGNIYQLAVPVARGAGLSQAIYYARNITAAAAGTNTVTVTFNAATPYVDIRALEYSGLDPLNPFDVGTSASGNSASANSGSVTTTAASELIFAAGMTTGGFSAAGASFTNRIITTPDLDIAEDRFVTTTGSYNATASLNGASAWVMQVATFRAANQA